MDWPESTQPLIVGFPRGRERNGIAPAGLVDDPNPLRWTSRYSSLVTTIYGIGTVDGFNEAGLAGHGLYLEATDFGPAIRPSPRYRLDCGCSTCWTRLPRLPRRWR